MGTVDGRGFGAAVEDYTRHRAGFPDSLFDRLRELGLGLAGQRVLDLGTGTGSLARGFARAGARVLALDPDARMLAAARALDLLRPGGRVAIVHFDWLPLAVPHRVFAALGTVGG